MGMKKRTHTRELAMELLYQSSINDMDIQEIKENHLEEYEVDAASLDMEYLDHVLQGVKEHQEALDAVITIYLKKWKLSRISKVNLSILRLAAYEILHMEEIDDKVSINEALDIAAKYSDEQSGAFINAVLDNISKHKAGVPEATEE